MAYEEIVKLLKEIAWRQEKIERMLLIQHHTPTFDTPAEPSNLLGWLTGHTVDGIFTVADWNSLNELIARSGFAITQTNYKRRNNNNTVCLEDSTTDGVIKVKNGLKTVKYTYDWYKKQWEVKEI